MRKKLVVLNKARLSFLLRISIMHKFSSTLGSKSWKGKPFSENVTLTFFKKLRSEDQWEDKMPLVIFKSFKIKDRKGHSQTLGIIQTLRISKMQMWKPTEKDRHQIVENATQVLHSKAAKVCSRKLSWRKCNRSRLVSWCH